MVLILTILTILMPIMAIPLLIIALFAEGVKYKGYIIFLLSITLGSILYNIIPDYEMDLYRYYELMNNFKYYDVTRIKEIISSSDPLTYSLMFIIAKLGKNQFLPFYSIMIIYNLFYLAMNKTLKHYRLNKAEYNKAIFFMLSFIIIVGAGTGVRFSMAICFFMNGLYHDVIKHSKWKYIWYFLSVVSHLTMALLLIIRIIIYICKNKPSKLIYTAFALIMLSPSLIITIFASIAKIPFLSDLAIKLNYYLDPHIPGGPWYLFRMTVFLLTFVLLCKSKKYIHDRGIGPIIQLEFFLAIISICTIPYYFISIRFINIFNNLIIFIMIYNWYKKSNINYINLILLTIFILFSTYQWTLLLEQNYGDLFLYRWVQNIFVILS